MKAAIAILLLSSSCLAAAQTPVRPAKVGDVHVYSVSNKTDRLEFDETVKVVSTDGGSLKTQQVRSDTNATMDGAYTPDWGIMRSGTSGMQMDPPSKTLSSALEVGSSWEYASTGKALNGSTSRIAAKSTVIGQEKLKTPAGEFDTLKISTKGYVNGINWGGGFGFNVQSWYAPSIHRIVREEYREQRTMGAENIRELKQFKPAE